MADGEGPVAPPPNQYPDQNPNQNSNQNPNKNPDQNPPPNQNPKNLPPPLNPFIPNVPLASEVPHRLQSNWSLLSPIIQVSQTKMWKHTYLG